MCDNKFLPKLSQNLLEILEDNEFYDITIEVGNDPYVKIFRAHMVILNYRSPYLRRILSTSVNKNKNDGSLTHQITKYFKKKSNLNFTEIFKFFFFVLDIFMEEDFL
jgi:hypothetical protein